MLVLGIVECVVKQYAVDGCRGQRNRLRGSDSAMLICDFSEGRKGKLVAHRALLMHQQLGTTQLQQVITEAAYQCVVHQLALAAQQMLTQRGLVPGTEGLIGSKVMLVFLFAEQRHERDSRQCLWGESYQRLLLLRASLA